MNTEVILAGAGVMGAAAARELSRRGAQVLAIDRFEPPHAHGSSHGETRVIREAYFEGVAYVPMIQRAYELWQSLEAESGLELLRLTGGLFVGGAESELISGTMASSDAHDLGCELLERAECVRRFPQFNLDDGMVAIWEPHTGALFPEACVRALIAAAERDGAAFRFGETVTGWRRDGDGVLVQTDRGEYRAAKLVIAAGPWTGELLPDLSLPLTVTREVMFWFEPTLARELVRPERLPVFAIAHKVDRMFYGFPDFGAGPKAAIHRAGPPTSPETIDRTVTDTDAAPLLDLMQHHVPGVAGRVTRGAVCMYTNTPDVDFVIDFHPGDDRVLILSPCSGHGFKFASAVGEAAAELVTAGAYARCDLSMFRVGRFA